MSLRPVSEWREIWDDLHSKFGWADGVMYLAGYIDGIEHTMKHNLISHGRIGDRGHHHDWISRDYLDVDCQATGCKFNIGKKCATPSRCKISPNGACEGFEAKPMPKKIDGD